MKNVKILVVDVGGSHDPVADEVVA